MPAVVPAAPPIRSCRPGTSSPVSDASRLPAGRSGKVIQPGAKPALHVQHQQGNDETQGGRRSGTWKGNPAEPWPFATLGRRDSARSPAPKPPGLRLTRTAEEEPRSSFPASHRGKARCGSSQRRTTGISAIEYWQRLLRADGLRAPRRCRQPACDRPGRPAFQAPCSRSLAPAQWWPITAARISGPPPHASTAAIAFE